jgi:hypothetical protein
MRWTMLLVALATACSSQVPPNPTPDIAQADMAVPSDMVTPVDMFMACTMPEPWTYDEYIVFNYTPKTGPNQMLGMYNTAIVQNDGTIAYAAASFPFPQSFHCSLGSVDAVDKKTCKLACCQGDPGIVPMLYFNGLGWALVRQGACQYKDPADGYVYTINVVQVNGTKRRPN